MVGRENVCSKLALTQVTERPNGRPQEATGGHRTKQTSDAERAGKQPAVAWRLDPTSLPDRKALWEAKNSFPFQSAKMTSSFSLFNSVS